MSEAISLGERMSGTIQSEPVVEIFDPPMCCPTGMCGPTIDPVLLDVNEMIVALQTEGIRVARYQMASHAQAFVNNREVFRLIREKQMAALPITVVRGQILQVGAYPTLAQVRAALGDLQIT